MKEMSLDEELKLAVIKQCEKARKYANTIKNPDEKDKYLKEAFNQFQTAILKLGIDSWKGLVDVSDPDEE